MNYVSLSILVLNSLSPLWKHLLSDWWLTGVCRFFGFVLGFFKWRCGFVRVLCIHFTIKLILLCDSHNKTKLWYAIIKSSWLVPKSNLSVCLKLPTHQLRNAAVEHTDKLKLVAWLVTTDLMSALMTFVQYLYIRLVRVTTLHYCIKPQWKWARRGLIVSGWSDIIDKSALLCLTGLKQSTNQTTQITAHKLGTEQSSFITNNTFNRQTQRSKKWQNDIHKRTFRIILLQYLSQHKTIMSW